MRQTQASRCCSGDASFVTRSVPWIGFIGQRDTPCDKRSVPGEYNIFYVENSTYINALTEYNDVKSRKKIGGNIYDKKSYTDR